MRKGYSATVKEKLMLQIEAEDLGITVDELKERRLQERLAKNREAVEKQVKAAQERERKETYMGLDGDAPPDEADPGIAAPLTAPNAVMEKLKKALARKKARGGANVRMFATRYGKIPMVVGAPRSALQKAAADLDNPGGPIHGLAAQGRLDQSQLANGQGAHLREHGILGEAHGAFDIGQQRRIRRGRRGRRRLHRRR